MLECEINNTRNNNTEARLKSNVFATKPTTKITPLPIRFSDNERIGLTELGCVPQLIWL